MREVSEIEARLKRHRDDNRYIDNQIERLETLILRMKGVSSPSLSGMPHNPSSDVDKIGQMLERKEKLEADIRELIADRDRERDELRSIIGCIHKPDQRSVLEMRYLDGAEWREIAEMLSERTRSQVVQVIGKKIVLYREGKEEKKKIILP